MVLKSIQRVFTSGFYEIYMLSVAYILRVKNSVKFYVEGGLCLLCRHRVICLDTGILDKQTCVCLLNRSAL